MLQKHSRLFIFKCDITFVDSIKTDKTFSIRARLTKRLKTTELSKFSYYPYRHRAGGGKKQFSNRKLYFILKMCIC